MGFKDAVRRDTYPLNIRFTYNEASTKKPTKIKLSRSNKKGG